MTTPPIDTPHATSAPASPTIACAPVPTGPGSGTPPVGPQEARRAWRLAHARVGLLLTGAVATLMLVGAVLVQLIGHEEPCPLCVLQRYACVLVAIVAWCAAWRRPARPVVRPLVALALVPALTGLGVAVHHTVVVWHPIVSCGFDTLQPIVNGLPTARLWPTLFQAWGMCTNPATLLGLPLPVWSALGFLGLTLLLAGIFWGTARAGSRSPREACPRCG